MIINHEKDTFLNEMCPITWVIIVSEYLHKMYLKSARKFEIIRNSEKSKIALK